ncbi:MAG: glyceraldehyde-3-phosphate dehydrogenase [Deferribacterales bacterium]|jgi:glyceraldehyde 3-phosphate dehydrogenase|uniref:glyceraldehyde-3-phosphate dehydrogenase n=1 Tax=Deferrivibrio essentukiensis TaxID=2880922 RepID=UPI001988B8C0|nr:glyceraldehyde-3-phosphate dehydrogenase [Deferrivibrio essentukiensis]MBC7195828.1 glyceraldehyde-3-phosphate dehydrogenase [Deferribacterales bacterium]MCB4205325.1 glyceraldehyde-3-phosphate dehydrogenase [Deferrivibrio essentukiensis]
MNKEAQYFQDFNERLMLAEEMLPLIGRLYRERSVVSYLYGKPLVNKTAIEILKEHRFARQILENELSVRETYPVVKAVESLNISPCRLDIGKLTTKFINSGADNLEEFLKSELSEVLGKCENVLDKPQDVVLYGFGRIGRLLARILIDKVGKGDKLRLRAIVVRKGKDNDLVKRAALLRRDSVHGPFNGTIIVDEEENALVANGVMIKVIYADSPENVDYESYGIKDAIVIDNTGKWRDREGLSKHLKAKGVSKVLLTAPGKGDIPNIVYGVNNSAIDPNEKILSAASCTTNAIVPVLKAINDRFSIVSGHIETCHSYTNDQNLLDNYHKKNRRGRSAPLNMVITETGAASAVAKALPELKGKLTGNAIRVPTPNVSLAVLQLNLAEQTTKKDVNSYLRDISLDSPLQNQIDYTNSPEVVSSDFVGSRYACIVDSEATIVDGNKCILYLWYDNEYGYSNQVIRLVQEIAGVNLKTIPA